MFIYQISVEYFHAMPKKIRKTGGGMTDRQGRGTDKPKVPFEKLVDQGHKIRNSDVLSQRILM
jgi:hypothetical protein